MTTSESLENYGSPVTLGETRLFLASFIIPLGNLSPRLKFFRAKLYIPPLPDSLNYFFISEDATADVTH